MARCYCRTCNLTFAGLSGFDRHLRWPNRPPWVEHLDPADRGMTLLDGLWFDKEPSRARSGNSSSTPRIGGREGHRE